MTKENSYTYSGHENLLAMQHARNYNDFLGRMIHKYGQGYATIVDFGAGVGAFADTAKVWAGRLVCVEPDHKQLVILQSSGFETVPDISLLPDASVDYVYSVNVLEHIEDDIGVLAEISRKLRPGGRLLIYVPALHWLFTSMDREVGHVRRYSRGELNAKLCGAGYRITRSVYVDSIGVLATLAYKWFANKQKGRINVGALKAYDRFVFPLSLVLDLLLGKLLGKNLLVVCEKNGN
jgi:SAM-dependent methyltransferase